MPWYHERPPSKFWHHEMGWSLPIAPEPGSYVDSSSVCRTWTSARGSAVKLYHSSKRLQRGGSVAVDGWVGSSVTAPAHCCCRWLRKRAPPPVSRPYQGTVCMASVAACSPTKPPPARM